MITHNIYFHGETRKLTCGQVATSWRQRSNAVMTLCVYWDMNNNLHNFLEDMRIFLLGVIMP